MYSLVTSTKDAHVWLEKKRCLLNNEEISKRKLAGILFSATLSFKLLPKANSAIKSVTYILQNSSDDNTVAPLTDKVIDHLLAKLIDPINTLNTVITSAKNFMEATTQQQALSLVNLQDSLKQQSELVKFLGKVVKKAQQHPIPKG